MTYYYNGKMYNTDALKPEEEVDKFLKKYEATGELSRRRLYAKLEPLRYRDWMADGSPIPFEQNVQREPMVEINMPQHRFQDLVERDRWIGRLEQEAEYYKQRYLEAVTEDRLRHQNPALMRAWERYQTLLNLVR